MLGGLQTPRLEFGAPPAAPPPAWPARRAPAAGPAAGRLKVWVVDDDPLVALYLGELLLDQGFAVTTFGDPRQALLAYEADPLALDVLVTDQRMPVISGEALAGALLQRRPRLRVILCSAYCGPDDERRALALGIGHFFRKPFDARALLRAVRGGESGPP